MKIINYYLLFISLIVIPGFAFNKSFDYSDAIYSEDNIYIPENLSDCFSELDKLISEDDKEMIHNGDIEPSELHHTLGMSLRNGWDLWGNSRLVKYFHELGIYHPDDMSGIILDSYVNYLKGEPKN